LSAKRDDPDALLFRDAVRDVKPMQQRSDVPLAKRKPPPRARFSAADRAAVFVESLQGLDGEITDTFMYAILRDELRP
jgi:DNA-nicking Smr family endonuclease